MAKTIKNAIQEALTVKVEEVEKQEVDTAVQDINECLYKASIFACYYLLRKGKQSLYDNAESASLLLNAVKMSKCEQEDFVKLLGNIYQVFEDLTESGIIPKKVTALDMVKAYAKENCRSLAKSAWDLYDSKKISYSDYKEIMKNAD